VLCSRKASHRKKSTQKFSVLCRILLVEAANLAGNDKYPPWVTHHSSMILAVDNRRFEIPLQHPPRVLPHCYADERLYGCSEQCLQYPPRVMPHSSYSQTGSKRQGKFLQHPPRVTLHSSELAPFRRAAGLGLAVPSTGHTPQQLLTDRQQEARKILAVPSTGHTPQQPATEVDEQGSQWPCSTLHGSHSTAAN